ncbi:MAG: hypothetical protein KF862_13535 [Chitinophagaceae bacterium]|nr:hypothetical protein [Chitinophagaceae bacterium]
MKNLIFFIAVVIGFSSCASTGLVHISVIEPAPVTLSSHIKQVGVINRSETDPRYKAVDVVDKVFSLEGAVLDKEGAAASAEGLTATLLKNDRFTAVRSIDARGIYSTAPGVLPSPMSWNEVERLCKANRIDALFALELFDTDSKIAYSVDTVKVNTPLGKVPAIEHTAAMNTLVKTGWRIYDPVNKIILDEISLSNHLNFYGKGINPAAAVAALLLRKDAVKETGTKAGEEYAMRILPYRTRVTRNYYVKGTDQFKVAKRKAQTGNWDGAAELWQKETQNHDAKVAGRACYNMAIISEINGELNQAVTWAQKAYENYNNKLALQYVKILENRKVKNEILNDQVKR